MKRLLWKLILPLTVISMMMFTKWWYALVVDGPDEIFTGFPFAFVCSGWHTSLSLQIFVLEFTANLLTYFLIIFLLVYTIDRLIIKINVPRIVSIPLIVLSSLIVILSGLVALNPNNIYYVKRDFDIEIMETGFKFVWQKQERPDFYKYHPEFKIDTQIPKTVLRSDWIIKADSIDRETLVDHGQFLTDKNRVYRKFDFSDGLMILELEDADRKTFRAYGNSIYARDNKHIFDSRHGIIEQADLKTFQVVHVEMEDRIMKFGKDKFNYYFWDEIVTDTVGFGLKTREITKAQQ